MMTLPKSGIASHVIALAVGAFLGWGLLRWGRYSEPVGPAGRYVIKRSDGASNRSDDDDCCRQLARRRSAHIEAERELEWMKDQVAGYEVELYGTPIPWSTSDEAEMGESQLREIVESSIEACMPDGAAEMVSIDCDEPPCLAFVVFPDSDGSSDPLSLVSNCDRFRNTLESTTTMTRMVDCGERGLLPVLAVGPAYHTDEDRDPAALDNSNLSRRLKVRASEGLASIDCR